MPSDGSKITVEQWERSGADMWVSVQELGESELNVQAAGSHDTEWLSCGPILKEHVVQVMPYDGDSEHHDDGTYPVVRSKRNAGWIWSWDLKRWIQDVSLLPTAETRSNKRKRCDAQDDDGNDPTQSQRSRMDQV